MKKYYPSFYKDFSCLASACLDSCCSKWEIPVDEKSKQYFASLDNGFGEKIRNSIVTDADGDDIFVLKSGNCPFLNADKLCEIRINLGWEHTCEVCRQHPDFIEEYECFTEVCPSVSCPAVIPLVFSDKAEYPEHAETCADEYLSFLLKKRNDVYDILSSGKTFSSAAEDALSCLCSAEISFAEKYSGDDLPLETEDFSPLPEEEVLQYYDEITAHFQRCEILTDEWKSVLERSLGAADETVLSAFSADDGAMTQALSYLVFRYFLKAVNGYSAAGLFRLLVNIVTTLKVYSVVTETGFEEICRLASKETEHNCDNTESFADYFL